MTLVWLCAKLRSVRYNEYNERKVSSLNNEYIKNIFRPKLLVHVLFK